MFAIGLIDNDSYAVYDGGHVDKNCTDINTAEFSYNNAIFAHGAAFMYNYVSALFTMESHGTGEDLADCCRPAEKTSGRRGHKSWWSTA
jgi:hypothetical protein